MSELQLFLSPCTIIWKYKCVSIVLWCPVDKLRCQEATYLTEINKPPRGICSGLAPCIKRSFVTELFRNKSWPFWVHGIILPKLQPNVVSHFGPVNVFTPALHFCPTLRDLHSCIYFYLLSRIQGEILYIYEACCRTLQGVYILLLLLIYEPYTTPFKKQSFKVLSNKNIQ